MRWFASFFVSLLAAHVLAQQQYDFVDLTELHGPGLSARDINNLGVVVANKVVAAPESQACIIENGKLEFLPLYQGKHRWVAAAINDAGDVLGSGVIAGTRHTMLYRNGTVIDLGLPGSKGDAAGIGLDNLGRVVGTTQVGVPQAFVWENGVTTFLPGLSEWGSGAVAISDSGVITGTSRPGISGPSHAVRWVNGIVEDIQPAWANHHGSGVAVNEAGDIAGWGWAIPGGQQGVVWTGGKTIQLPNFGGGSSRAYDINSTVQVVGFAASPSFNEAFFWDDNEIYRLTDLLMPGHGLGFSFAQNINNGGQILTVGGEIGSKGAAHWYLLNPVPEVATGVQLGLALGVLTLSRFRRKRKKN